MADPLRSRARRVLLPSTGTGLLSLVAVGTLVRGPASGLAIAGLLLTLGGVIAVAAGGARWARIGDRRTAAAVAVLGLAVFLAGATVESRTAGNSMAPDSSSAAVAE